MKAPKEVCRMSGGQMEVQQPHVDVEGLLKGLLKALLEEQSPHYALSNSGSPEMPEVRDGE